MPPDRKTFGTVNDVVATNEKITSELLIIRNVNSNLEKHITTLEKVKGKA